ncbi:Ger(x)C family spore germination protein [Paenibacillus dokdonensis]|uniref:Ger(X)C family spore germination protein n=1 Tax=Paenibacillus dokdonensis TaxID=2567944 RepID=A0ABU6GSA5_9BACL|nr:Ger(x)C family spore germination protein [Paenibacillus dokdonensis]MEC0242234.1 Ger(x)C family spore germination protein [Paenibacillus dokdonensis]
MSKRVLKLFIVCVVLLGTALQMTGCNKSQRILEKLAIDHTIGYDLDEEQKLNVTAAIINQGEGGSEVKQELITAEADSSKEAKIKLSRQTSRNIVSGQLRNTMYSMDVASQGIRKLIENLVRDPSISPRVKITVVNGSVKELLNSKFPNHPNTSQYVDHLLEKNWKNQNIPQVNIYQFTRDYLDDGVDPVAPIVRKKEDNVIIDGLALFKDDKYVGKLSPDYNMLFAMSRGKYRQGEIYIKLDQNDSDGAVMLGTVSSDKKFKVWRKRSGGFVVELFLEVKGDIMEYTGNVLLSNHKDIITIEKGISKYISNKMEDMVDIMKDKRADNVGLGKQVRNSISYKEWKTINWDELYPEVTFRCTVNTKIKSTGEILEIPVPSRE